MAALDQTLDARLIEALDGIGVLGEWSFDYGTQIFRSSPGVSQAFAIPAEDGECGQLVERYERAVHPRDLNWLRLTRAAAPGWSGLRVTEIRVIDMDGRERWIMVRGRFVLGQDGEPAFGYGVMLDVTDYNQSGERPFVTPAAPFVDPLFVLLEALSVAYRASRQIAQGAIERSCRALLFKTAAMMAKTEKVPMFPDVAEERQTGEECKRLH